jgi:putative glutathione S-transferase
MVTPSASSATGRKPRGKALPAKAIIGLGRWGWTTMWHLMMSQLAPRNKAGEYLRPESQFRQFISDRAGYSYPPVADRYRLCIGYGCPWAHRTLVVRALKGLEEAIPLIVVSPSPIEGGWVFEQTTEGCQTLSQLYRLAQPDYNSRSTVPVLWDVETKTIVNNESADLILMLNSEWNAFAKYPDVDLYPEDLRSAIDQWSDKIYDAVNNGVYRCGFAQTQTAYEAVCNQLFVTLDEIDLTLKTQRYLCGDRITLADVRLFTTLFRFDTVYYGLFKCNRRRIQDYEQLGNYLRDLYQLPGVASTCRLDVVKQDYYGNLFPLNPGGIIPVGPDIDLSTPHGRDRLGN